MEGAVKRGNALKKKARIVIQKKKGSCLRAIALQKKKKSSPSPGSEKSIRACVEYGEERGQNRAQKRRNGARVSLGGGCPRWDRTQR